MLINVLYIKDICLRMSEFSHYQFIDCHWLNFIQSENSWDPTHSCSVMSYGLSELVLDSGGVHMMSHNKHHGGLHVVLGEWYINVHFFIKKIKYVWYDFIWALNFIIFHRNHPLLFPFLDNRTRGRSLSTLAAEVEICPGTNERQSSRVTRPWTGWTCEFVINLAT